MKILERYSLKETNAFRVDVFAKHFALVENVEDLGTIYDYLQKTNEKYFVMGQGWNTLFTKDFDGLVIKINLKGKSIVQDNKDFSIVEAYAGEDWIEFVIYLLNLGLYGAENLTLIPGTVGAVPAQNIAAYGQNQDEIFESLEAFDLISGKLVTFNKTDCKFCYRDSIFKHTDKKNFVVTKVRFKLSKNPTINTDYHSRYDSMIGELSTFTKPPYTPAVISRAVENIRRRKLPDWTKVGTAGSFFLNPIISKTQLAELQKIVPGVQYYPVDELTYPKPDDPAFKYSDHVKVAAGWLLEELGWKGKRIGDVGTSPTQALVVINYGGASAQDIINFTNNMKSDFKRKYNIELKEEVNII